MAASDVTFFGLVIRGLIGLLILVILSGLGYLAAGLLARTLSSKTWKIYSTRFAIMIGFVVLWWFSYFEFFFRAPVGNQLLADSWYRMAFREGVGYGMHSIWAWCVVALIDWPERTQASQTERNTDQQTVT